jgi:hypothetical protein
MGAFARRTPFLPPTSPAARSGTKRVNRLRGAFGRPFYMCVLVSMPAARFLMNVRAASVEHSQFRK